LGAWQAKPSEMSPRTTSKEGLCGGVDFETSKLVIIFVGVAAVELVLGQFANREQSSTKDVILEVVCTIAKKMRRNGHSPTPACVSKGKAFPPPPTREPP